MSRFPEELQVDAVKFMTETERDNLLVGARDAGLLVFSKFLMPGLSELKTLCGLEGIPTKEDLFLAWGQGVLKDPENKWFKGVLTDAYTRGDKDFFICYGNLSKQKKVPFPRVEMWLIMNWITRGKASLYENLCLWSDKALAQYFKACMKCSHDEASFRKMRQRLKLRKSKSIWIKGFELSRDGKRCKLIFGKLPDALSP